MKKTYEFRLYPTAEQQRALLRTLDACREVYNAMLLQRQMAYDRRVRLSRFDQEKQLAALRADDPEFGAVYSHLLQDAARRLDLALRAFFRRCKAGETPGYPRFQGRDRYESFTFKEPDNGCVRLDAARGRVSFSKVAQDIRCFFHRPITGTVPTATVKRRASGWFLLLSCDDVPPDPALKKGSGAVGIDLGVTHFATLSTGETLQHPRPLARGLRALAACQRRVSRKVRGSGRRRKEVRLLRRHHERIHNQSKDFAFKTARSLVERFDEIAVEDLTIQELVQNGGGPKALRRNILDASWGGVPRRPGAPSGRGWCSRGARGTPWDFEAVFRLRRIGSEGAQRTNAWVPCVRARPRARPQRRAEHPWKGADGAFVEGRQWVAP